MSAHDHLFGAAAADAGRAARRSVRAARSASQRCGHADRAHVSSPAREAGRRSWSREAARNWPRWRKSAHGLVRRQAQVGRALCAAHHMARRRGAGDRGSLFLRPAAVRFRSAPVFRRPPFRAGQRVRRAAVPRSTAWQGVVFSVWAPNARRVSVVGDFNSWDGRRHPMRLRHSAGVWELFVPRLGPASATSSRSPARTARSCKRPIRWPAQTELPPGTASIVAPLPEFSWTDDDWMEERGTAPRARRADQRLRGPCRIVDEAGRRRRRRARLARAGRQADPLCRGDGLHPCRAAADHGASLRRVVGLSAAVAIRAFRPLRHARGFRRLRRCMPPRRHRRHPRLGARAFPDRRARPGPFRRHASLRTCRPARGLPPGLEHADLQSRPQRGVGLPARLGDVVARDVPCRRAARRCGRLDALPRLQPQARANGCPTSMAGARTSNRSPSSSA